MRRPSILPQEYQDLVLCRDVYHCRPSELDQEDFGRVSIHLALLEGEAKATKAEIEAAKARKGR